MRTQPNEPRNQLGGRIMLPHTLGAPIPPVASLWILWYGSFETYGFFSTPKFLDKSLAGKALLFRALWSISRAELSLLAIVTGGRRGIPAPQRKYEGESRGNRECTCHPLLVFRPQIQRRAGVVLYRN
jgi:hypothetical protein